MMRKKEISTPLKSANGINVVAKGKFRAKNVEQMCLPEHIMNAYEWLVYSLKRTIDKLEHDMKTKSVFNAKNDNQVFFAKSLAIIFKQRFFLQKMLDKISECQDVSLRNVLSKLFALYALWLLEKHLSTLYLGGYAVGLLPATLVQEAILKLCTHLKNNAVLLVDVIAHPDFGLKFALGSLDGEVYKRLENNILNWWQGIVNWKGNVIKSKL